ncbi:MAG: hypothetical protein NC905_02730 [Candidatus Omnitrophica bacterium]|nr:hypothetical protein [Candidatus Omnitrophota bacterium]
MGKVKYHLRFQIIPGKNVKEDTKVLAEFCLKHKIEEVVLFFAGEEWNNGLLSAKEEDIWFEAIKTAKKTLKERGIKVSLNPWMTVLHCDRGRRFPPDRKFEPMVSPYGETSKATASFVDKNWQRYIYNLYGRFATLGFNTIWIEDDFRYHNHAPLTWGGGFEKRVLKKFSTKIGKQVSREDLVKRILQPGKPHPWRKIWMEVWREIQLEVASGIRDAVEKSSKGKTKLGLMSSHPSVHSIEGRRWHNLFNALTINNKVVHRPNFAPYQEDVGRNKFHSIMMLDIQKKLRPVYCEVEPEIENFPFTKWSKSNTQTWAEMALSLFFGSDALLLNLFPFVGNRADEEKGIGELLNKSYKSLLWISDRFSKEHSLYGIGIPWKEDAAEKTETIEGKRFEELRVDPSFTWKFLLSYGIPACSEIQEVNAIFGNNAWIFDDNEIIRMLKGGLLLDGESARILCKRGFGKYIGVEYEKTLNREDSNYSVEVVKSSKSGVKEGIYFSVNQLPEFNVFKPSKKTTVWTDVITSERKSVGPSITLYTNEMGGRVAIVVPSHFNFHKQTIVQNIIRYLYKKRVSFPLVSGSVYLMPLFFKKGAEEILCVFNGCPDPAVINIEMCNKPQDATLLKPLEKPSSERILKETNNIWRSTSMAPYMSFLVIEFSKNR